MSNRGPKCMTCSDGEVPYGYDRQCRECACNPATSFAFDRPRRDPDYVARPDCRCGLVYEAHVPTSDGLVCSAGTMDVYTPQQAGLEQ